MSKSEMTPGRMLRSVGVGGLLAAAITFLLTMLLGALLSSGKLPEQSIPPLAMVIAAAAAFAGAMTAAAAVGQRRLPVSLAVGAVYLLLMLMGRGLWFRGQWSALPAVAVAAAVLTAGLLSSRPKKRRR